MTDDDTTTTDAIAAADRALVEAVGHCLAGRKLMHVLVLMALRVLLHRDDSEVMQLLADTAQRAMHLDMVRRACSRCRDRLA